MCPSGSLGFDLSKRLNEIKEETLAFLSWRDGDPLPDGRGGLQTFEFVPEPIFWLRFIDRYGLPLEGGWLDQPIFFMRDIEAARMARDRYDAEKGDESLKLLAQIRELLK